MLTLDTLSHLQILLQEQNLDGWLLFDFKGRNPIASAVVGNQVIGTRRLFVFIPRNGFPTAIVHEIDAELWHHWPAEWNKAIWIRQEELEHVLSLHIKQSRVALDFSSHGISPDLDCIPFGVVSLLSQLECDLVPSAELVTQFLSIWTEEDRRSHACAAESISAIAQCAMQRVAHCLDHGDRITEFDVSQWIRQAFEHEGLVTDSSSPSVSTGCNAARNHYEASQSAAAAIVPGQLLLIDLWAKNPGGIYADQTWMASIGPPNDRDAQLWTIVRDARDAALDLLKARLRDRQQVTGAEVDSAARQVITAAGFAFGIAGRTGHSIDRYGLHGFGPTIDDIETHDHRVLVSGVGFSIEPGIYVKGVTGVRSEVNVYLTDQEAVVTPNRYQTELIVL